MVGWGWLPRANLTPETAILKDADVNSAQALHTAARRYCNEHYTHWCKQYSLVSNSGRAVDGYHYTEKALDTFPRYTMLNAIRVNIERIDPNSLTNFADAKKRIISDASKADDDFTRNPIDDIARNAQEEEREKFCQYIDVLTEDESVNVGPLPYQRVLLEGESSTVWNQLHARWGLEPRSCWYPLAETSYTDLVAFNAECFRKSVPVHALIRKLQALGVQRIWELREFDTEYEQDVELFFPDYNGAEGVWTSSEYNWVVYASHELSITVAGILFDEVKRMWPKWADHKWEWS